MSFPNNITIHDTANKDKFNFTLQDDYHLNLKLPEDYTQNPDDPLTLKYTKWYGNGQQYESKAIQNGANYLYQFYLHFRADDIQTCDLYGTLKQLVTESGFKKVVNGVTFTSDNFKNIDVTFERTRVLTYIYISTTDNHAFNSTTINNYYIVHDYSGLSVTKIELQNDNKTAKLSVWTSEFNENNSYNIKQLPLIETQLTPHFTGSITNSLHDSTTYTKDDKDVITLKANDGYKIKSASLDYQPYPGAGNQSLGDFTISSDKLTATITIPDNVKNDKTINLTISGETSTDLQHINPSLKANNVTVSITGNTVNLKANDGYLIDSATLDVGNSLFGDNTPLNFTVAPDKKTATVTITDEKLIDPNQQYDLTVKTSIEQVLKVQYQYNSSLVSVTTSTSDYQVNTPFTLNATPTTGYSYDKVDNIYSVSPSDNVTISQNGTKATITLPDKQTYTITLKDPTKLPTQKEVAYTQTGYTVYIPTDCSSINGTGNTGNKDGYQVVPPTGLTLNSNIVSTIYADVNGDNSNRVQGSLADNKIVFAFSDPQWSPLTTSRVRDSDGNLIYNLQDYVNQLKPKFTGTITSKIQGVTASLNNMTGVITITIPDNTTLTRSINVLDNAGKTITTLEVKNNSATVPTQYATNNFEVVGSLVYATNYKVDITQVKEFVDYTTNQLTITLTAKENITITSLHAVADLSWSGESYKLDDSVINISTDKKTATITVPNDYNSKLGYTIVITGDFSKLTPPPVNPSGTNSIHVYQLDDETLTKFSTKAMEYFQDGKNTVYDFQKFITQLYKLPFNIPENASTGTTNISTGWFTVNEPARKLNDTRYTLDLGVIKVVNVNNNGFDHNVKSCTLYLPFVSPLSVSYETILNHNLNVQYDTDLLTGKTTVNVFVDKELLNSFQVNINENLDLYNIYNDSINGSLSSILENTLDHCFIKVEYYQPINNLVSYETNEHGTLKDYHGYVQTKNTIVSCGTQEEQRVIMELLEQGVIIK